MHENWQTLLSEFIEKNRNVPFEFGKQDCSSFAAKALKELTGLDIYQNYEGKYSTAKGALKQLKKNDNCLQPIDVFNKHLGEVLPIAFAKKGDIVFSTNFDLFEPSEDVGMFGAILGLCNGSVSYFVGENGLYEVPTLNLEGCFNVRIVQNS